MGIDCGAFHDWHVGAILYATLVPLVKTSSEMRDQWNAEIACII